MYHFCCIEGCSGQKPSLRAVQVRNVLLTATSLALLLLAAFGLRVVPRIKRALLRRMSRSLEKVDPKSRETACGIHFYSLGRQLICTSLILPYYDILPMFLSPQSLARRKETR